MPSARTRRWRIVNAGWRLAYTNELPAECKAREDKHKYTDFSYSLGFSLGADGGVGDVLPDSPADRAGVNQGMKLVAVNGRGWSAKLLREAVSAAATNRAPVELLLVEMIITSRAESIITAAKNIRFSNATPPGPTCWLTF